jgi:hypothetical protein
MHRLAVASALIVLFAGTAMAGRPVTEAEKARLDEAVKMQGLLGR